MKANPLSELFVWDDNNLENVCFWCEPQTTIKAIELTISRKESLNENQNPLYCQPQWLTDRERA